MELQVLHSVATPLAERFSPAYPVENEESIVWTERYAGASDFVRTSYDIQGTLEMLPVVDDNGDEVITVVAIKGSTVPMVVETHQISTNADGAPKITTTGRSFETVLDRRTTLWSGTPSVVPNAPEQRPRQIEPPGSSAPGAMLNVSDGVPVWTTKQASGSAAAHYAMTLILGLSHEAIDEIVMTTFDTALNNGVTDDVKDFQVGPGELYSWVIDLLLGDQNSLRAIRPMDGADKIKIDMYKGKDNRFPAESSYKNLVTFDARFDQFDSSEFLTSVSTHRVVDQIAGTRGVKEVWVPGTTVRKTGLKRRVVYNDQTSVAKMAADLPAEKETLNNLLDSLGKIDLMRYLQTVMMSGEVSKIFADKYHARADLPTPVGYYALGDVVRLLGNYGIGRDVRVVEFIRSVDSSGETAYPTFAAIT